MAFATSSARFDPPSSACPTTGLPARTMTRPAATTRLLTLIATSRLLLSSERASLWRRRRGRRVRPRPAGHEPERLLDLALPDEDAQVRARDPVPSLVLGAVRHRDRQEVLEQDVAAAAVLPHVDRADGEVLVVGLQHERLLLRLA